MDMINFVKLICYMLKIHSCCWRSNILMIFAYLNVNHELIFYFPLMI